MGTYHSGRPFLLLLEQKRYLLYADPVATNPSVSTCKIVMLVIGQQLDFEPIREHELGELKCVTTKGGRKYGTFSVHPWLNVMSQTSYAM